MRTVKFLTGSLLCFSLLGADPVWAGRGSSPGAIQSAISSGSIDAIQGELERSEHLVCPVCVTMVRPLVDHPDRRVRQVAAWWLSRRGLQGDLIESMSARLGGADAVKARNAADVLGGMRNRGAVQPLGTTLVDGSRPAEVRVASALALGEIGDPVAQPALAKALTAAEATVRAAALESLRSLRGFEDGALAAPLLADGDETVRAQAIYTIGALRDRALAGTEATNIVRSLAAIVGSDPSARVRKKAAWALGEIHAPAGVAGPALSRAAQQDPDPLVRSLAAAAIINLNR